MRRLHPPPATTASGAGPYVDLVLGGPVEGRPWVALGMVASVDGAASLDGRTARLGGEADRIAFARVRDATDAILVGAGTVRAEDYGPGDVDEARRAARLARGLAPHPRIIVVTAEVAIGTDARLVGPRPHGSPPPLLVVPESIGPDAAERLDALVATGRVEVARVAGPTIDADALLGVLHGLGMRAVLCEGGPRLAGLLVAAGRIDEVLLTLAPTLVGPAAPRLLGTPDDGPVTAAVGPVDLELVELWEHDGELVLRYRRRSHVGPDAGADRGPDADHGAGSGADGKG
jgi:riboflavin biosynthesis pyrimidine reductase